MILTFFYVNNLKSQEIIAPSAIKWYSINEAFELNKKQNRPIIVDVYTDWCSWCKFMMKTTFANNGISSYINNNFYAARFNAELTDTVKFNDKDYINRQIGRRPTHDLANYLLDGKLSYPSLVYFDREGRKTVVPGYKESKDIEPILIYFNENLQSKISLNEFIINFMFTYPNAFENDHSIYKIDNAFKPDTLGLPEWQNLDKFGNKYSKKPKPILLFMYTTWCISCNVMENTTFGNTKVADFLNENFYIIKIDAASQDTINFFGKTFYGTGKNNPHQIATSLFQNNLQMPAIAFFDEKANLISINNGYLTTEQIYPFLKFLNEKKYVKMKYQDYLKEQQNTKVAN